MIKVVTLTMYYKRDSKLIFLIVIGVVSILSTFAQTLWLKNDLENLEKRTLKK